MTGRGGMSRTARRTLLLALTGVTTAAGAWAFDHVLAERDMRWLSTLLLLLFVVLFVWVALSFWIATAGFLRRLSGGSAAAGQRIADDPQPLAARTAILMPIYNETPHRVFAALRAMHESLQAAGHGDAFDFFILSDTTNPEVWLAEELAWARLNQSVAGGSRIYYRHRRQNTGRKAGNIADFCRRWGAGYEYMIVLDADSVMSGETINELVRRMQRDPQIGILQAPPIPVNRSALFARCQQFAARVYGPIFLEGFDWWADVDGNYWGHNAIIRVEAFVGSCGLSKLPGEGPLGGEILSHDFVEAALMRRAGYKVCMARDLEGSYEECPPTLIAFAQRDQRWCQGNLQHLRLVISSGMRPVSRLHMGMGAMAYLSSPIWLVFLLLSFASAIGSGTRPAGESETQGSHALGLFVSTMALLLLPKLWSYFCLLRDRDTCSRCGGALRAGLSVLIESLVSILVAPIMMIFHATFVAATFLGWHVQWNAQERDEGRQTLRDAVAAHWQQTLAGVLIAWLSWTIAPAMFLWLIPVVIGLILAVPLSLMLGSVRLGHAAARHGLFQTPEEAATPPVLERYRYLLGLPVTRELADRRDLFRRVLADPALLALHRSILEATGAQQPVEERRLRTVERQLLVGGLRRVSADLQRAVLADPAALRHLHLFAWTSRRRGDSDEPSETA